jgi:hypothetical protein
MKFRVPNLRLGAVVLAAVFAAAVFAEGRVEQGPVFGTKVYLGASGACVLQTGAGSPETAVTGNVCDFYLQTNGTAGATLFIKESGTATNTGWRAVATGITSNVALLNAVNTFTAFGTHSFTGSGVGSNRIDIRNTLAGAGNSAGMRLGNDTAANLLEFFGFSSTFTTAGPNVANGVLWNATGAGGASIQAQHASGDLRFYTGGNTLRGTMLDTGVFDWEGNVTVKGGSITQGVDDTASAYVNAPENLTFSMDTANDSTTRTIDWRKDGVDGGGTLLMRLLESGYLGIGGITPTRPLHVNLSIADFVTEVQNPNANPAGLRIEYTTATPNGTANEFIYANDPTSARFVVRSNGGIANFQANNVNLSDASMKAISGQAPSFRADFRRLQFVKGKYLDSKRATDDVMLTAQQVETVFPDAVEWFDEAKGLKGIREQQIVMRGLAIIQELDQVAVEQAGQIADLQQRVQALEQRLERFGISAAAGVSSAQPTQQVTLIVFALLACAVVYQRQRQRGV